MIRKLVRQMLTAQVFSALTVSLCLLIDSIMIGHFLGEEAIAAYGLANPLLMAIGAIGSLLAAGSQVVRSRSLGRGLQEETNAGFSAAAAVALGISLTFVALVFPFCAPFATLLGAGTSGSLFEQTRDYLAGFSVGAPGSMGALVLVPFLQMAGQSGLLIAAVLTMTVTDVALDLLNVLVFHGGMMGMGLASALSYYAAMAVAAFYFLSKKCMFHFSLRQVTGRKIAELLRSGVPAGFSMAAAVILVFLMNRILRGCGGSGALAAFAVVNSIGSVACCIVTGIGGVSLTLSGILYHEEDRGGLRELLRLLCRYAVYLGVAVGLVLLAFAPQFVSLFIAESGSTRDAAALGLRLYAAGLVPCCINSALKNAYQGTERERLTEGISMLEGAVLPVPAAFVCSRLMGTAGAWLYFGLGEGLTLVCVGLFIGRKSGMPPWRESAALLLKRDFGVSAENLMEADIHSLQEAAAVSEQAGRFCLAHGGSAWLGNRIALCVEEMASNVIQYGFAADKAPHHLSVRILNKPSHWVLRFRDDCAAFDPVHYVPKKGQQPVGIALAMKLSQDARYTYSLNLNNLVLKLPKDDHALKSVEEEDHVHD